MVSRRTPVEFELARLCRNRAMKRDHQLDETAPRHALRGRFTSPPCFGAPPRIPPNEAKLPSFDAILFTLRG